MCSFSLGAIEARGLTEASTYRDFTQVSPDRQLKAGDGAWSPFALGDLMLAIGYRALTANRRLATYRKLDDRVIPAVGIE